MLNIITPLIIHFLCVPSVKAEPFSETKEYQAVDQVWKWFIDYMTSTKAQKPLNLNYFVHREVQKYSKMWGYLWPENQTKVENQLKLFRSFLRENPTSDIANQYYYPYQGLTPFTDAEFQKYYEHTAQVNRQAREVSTTTINATQFIDDLQFVSYFENYQPYGSTLLLKNTKSPMYSLLFGEMKTVDIAYDELRDLCTPTNRMINEKGKQVKMEVESTIEDIAIAFYTLALLEANYNISKSFRDTFKVNIVEPLSPYKDLSTVYAEGESLWPETRRSYIDQCRTDFESAGRLEVLIARSKQ